MSCISSCVGEDRWKNECSEKLLEKAESGGQPRVQSYILTYSRHRAWDLYFCVQGREGLMSDVCVDRMEVLKFSHGSAGNSMCRYYWGANKSFEQTEHVNQWQVWQQGTWVCRSQVHYAAFLMVSWRLLVQQEEGNILGFYYHAAEPLRTLDHVSACHVWNAVLMTSNFKVVSVSISSSLFVLLCGFTEFWHTSRQVNLN